MAAVGPRNDQHEHADLGIAVVVRRSHRCSSADNWRHSILRLARKTAPRPAALLPHWAKAYG